jgi:uncharacterized DUF497 family protein
MNDRFEWDNNKAASNWRSHGVTFDQAVVAISDPFASNGLLIARRMAKSASISLACVRASFRT